MTSQCAGEEWYSARAGRTPVPFFFIRSPIVFWVFFVCRAITPLKFEPNIKPIPHGKKQQIFQVS